MLVTLGSRQFIHYFLRQIALLDIPNPIVAEKKARSAFLLHLLIVYICRLLSFDLGVGKLVNSLTLGCDCLGAIEYLDLHMNLMDGSLMTVKNAVCIHEEDAGLLWKHMDFRTERTEVRRARRLVVSVIATVGNYEYAFYWYFSLDGTIEFEVKATGIINTACIPGKPGKYANEVSPGVAGQIHQHIFCARLDMAVDGDTNSIVEYNTRAESEGPHNRYGNAYYDEPSVLKTELEACRRTNPETMRYWKIINPSVKNHVGQPTAYRLEANHTVTPFVRQDSLSGRRAGFVRNHVWVTAFDPEERYPAGEYMNHSKGGGLPDYVAKNRPIENADLVLWHVFGCITRSGPRTSPCSRASRPGSG
jgi:primary-amine oxidase